MLLNVARPSLGGPFRRHFSFSELPTVPECVVSEREGIGGWLVSGEGNGQQQTAVAKPHSLTCGILRRIKSICSSASFDRKFGVPSIIARLGMPPLSAAAAKLFHGSTSRKKSASSARPSSIGCFESRAACPRPLTMWKPSLKFTCFPSSKSRTSPSAPLSVHFEEDIREGKNNKRRRICYNDGKEEISNRNAAPCRIATATSGLLTCRSGRVW